MAGTTINLGWVANSVTPLYDSDNQDGGRVEAFVHTITGTGFGTKPTGTVQYNDFEAQADLDTAASMGYDTSISGTAVSTVRAYAGTKSLRHEYAANPGGGSFPKVSTTMTDPTDKLYYSCWFYWEKTGTSYSPGIFKVFRAGDGDKYSGNPKFYLTYQGNAAGTLNGIDGGIRTDTGYNSLAQNESHNDTALPSPLPPAQDGWHFCEFFCRMASATATADGFFESWVDGERVINLRNRITMDAGDAGSEMTSAIGMIDGIDDNEEVMTLYIDSESIDNTGCRVIMTDNATYASSTKWASQPVTAWSDTSITCSKRRQGFSVNDTAYLHVFDDDGVLVDSGSSFLVTADTP